MNFLEDSIRLLRAKGYKITGPRVAVLEVLSKAEIPLSAYDIEEHIPKNIRSNVVTIYRVLDVFEELGIAHRIHTKEGYVRCDFELKRGCHYFAVCDKCGRTSEFLHKDPCFLKKIIPKNLPLKNLKHITEVSGTCQQCS
ncbi:transcriptional repressor [Patescibacteria group bacterium]|nr:transcriptional repressor [Patescibacteria group bacterium]MBU1685316.1 transcriptional repressor [Patescibacteria group bacterium]MBU1938950.1 transcriptional repressor [Patescibacteria group bacterium]